MKRSLVRKVLPWLVVAAVVAFAVYRLKFSPMPVTAYSICLGEVRGEVMGTGTLEARVKTTISPRIQERLAEVLVDQGDAVKVMELFRKVAHERGAAVLVVTHDHRSLDVFDRTLEMEDGRLKPTHN